MVKGRVSVVIPSRNEKYLGRTVEDLLAKARGDIRVIAVLDGYWPDPPLIQDKRLVQLHRGQSYGMRPAINSALQIADGEFILKADAHTMWGEGFDEILKADCDDDWVVVPRRMSLDPENWCTLNNGKSPVDAHLLSYPYERPGDPSCGLHGQIWPERSRSRKDVLVDDECSSQGSAYFMKRKHWDWLGPMEISKYGNFIAEFQEIGLKTALGGGRVMVNKQTTYHHFHKGKTGRGYSISKREQSDGSRFSIDYWMHDRWAERKHNLRWLIEKFWPMPTWPADLDEAFRPRRWDAESVSWVMAS